MAKATPLEPDWFNGQPIVKKASRTYSKSQCIDEMRQITLNGLNYYKEEDKHPKSWCVYHYKGFDITFYKRWFSSVIIDASDVFALYPREESGMAISFDGGAFTPVDGIDYSLVNYLVYVPNSDKPLIRTNCEYIGCALSFYDFKQHTGLNSASASQTYTYAAPSGEWSLKYEDGELIRSEGVGSSESGGWISFVIPSIGLVRMLMTTMEWDIVDSGYTYGFGSAVITTISNDGKLIMRVGSAGEQRVVRYVPLCTTRVPSRLDSTTGGYRTSIKTTCQYTVMSQAFLELEQSVPGYIPVKTFHLLGNGDRAILQESVHDSWYEVFPYNSPVDSRMTYLALGDSFSSGEGDVISNNLSHYLPGTNVLGNHESGIPRELCHVSDRSYPFLLAKDMGVTRGNNMQSIACSGAVRNDIYSSDTNSLYNGQPVLQFDGVTRPRLEGLINISNLQNDAIQNFIPGRVRQIELLKKHKPQVATVGVSGNDLGFAAILMECMTNIPSTPKLTDQTCSYADGEGLTSLGAAIQANYQKQVDLYTALKQASPGTDLYAVGYPQFIDNEKAFCWEIGNSLTKEERMMLVRAVSYANQTIKNAAATTGIKYIDIENAIASDGGDMCSQSNMITDPAEKVFAGSLTSVINRYEDGYARTEGLPISLGVYQAINDIDRNDKEGVYANAIALMMQEAFHPNARAHYAMYSYIHAYQSGTSLLNSQCDGVVIICPLEVNKKVPAIPEYFGATDVHTEFMSMVRVDDGTGQRYILQTGLTTVERGKLMQIIADESLNNPGSMAGIVIRSTPQVLGVTQVGVGGAYNTFVRIPTDMPVGYHVISVEGTDNVGKPVKYMQTIFVTGPKGDFDGDGIANTADTCEFIEPSGMDVDGDNVDDECDLEIKSTVPGLTRPDDAESLIASMHTRDDVITSDWSSMDGQTESHGVLGKFLPDLKLGKRAEAPLGATGEQSLGLIGLSVCVVLILLGIMWWIRKDNK